MYSQGLKKNKNLLVYSIYNKVHCYTIIGKFKNLLLLVINEKDSYFDRNSELFSFFEIS